MKISIFIIVYRKSYHKHNFRYDHVEHFSAFLGRNTITTAPIILTNPSKSITENAALINNADAIVAANSSTDANRIALDPPIRRTPSM